MKFQNKFQDLVKLRRLIVDLINTENGSAMGSDVKGDIRVKVKVQMEALTSVHPAVKIKIFKS